VGNRHPFLVNGSINLEDRLRIVRLVDEGRHDPQLVADVFGVSRSTVYDWLRKYRDGAPAHRMADVHRRLTNAIKSPATSPLAASITGIVTSEE
jgi:transposase-like protein